MRPTAQPQAPELPSQLEHAEITGLAHDATHAEIDLANAALPDQHANGVTFQTAKLTNGDLSGSRLEHLRLADSKLNACNLAKPTDENPSPRGDFS